LREAKRELHKSEKGKKELEEQAKDRLKSQEVNARKAEKKMTEGHKRDLAVMRGDLERIRGEERQIQQELLRKVRGKARRISNELIETQQNLVLTEEENVVLAKTVSTGTAKLQSLREDGARWKDKYCAVSGDVRVKTRELQKELEEKEQHLVAKEDKNGELVKAVSKGITKCKRVLEDGLRWKSKYLAEVQEGLKTGDKLTEAEQRIRDISKAGVSGKKRDADLHAELLRQLEEAQIMSEVFLSQTSLFFSLCLGW
jgi:hypothetical protein